MIFCITVLRALAAILITNAHYTGIYPTDLIANGGLLGDVIFFCVSGFCLYNIKDDFLQWYKKRIIRIYPSVWIITILYLILQVYNFESMNLFQYMIYPTYYHFVGSIIILYIFYYVVVYFIKNNNQKMIKEPLILIMGVVFLIYLILYVTTYDKSYYHIDNVREWMIRFLFFESMLLGVYFRKNYDKYANKNKIINWIIIIPFFILYFASKIMFSKGIITEYQIINQIILFVLLYCVVKAFIGINSKLEKLPLKIKKIINFIAELTLEIYVVQYPIISTFRNTFFPLNWIIITTTIIISAFLLHIIVDKLILKNRVFTQKEKANESTINRGI